MPFTQSWPQDRGVEEVRNLDSGLCVERGSYVQGERSLECMEGGPILALASLAQENRAAEAVRSLGMVSSIRTSFEVDDPWAAWKVGRFPSTLWDCLGGL